MTRERIHFFLVIFLCVNRRWRQQVTFGTMGYPSPVWLFHSLASNKHILWEEFCTGAISSDLIPPFRSFLTALIARHLNFYRLDISETLVFPSSSDPFVLFWNVRSEYPLRSPTPVFCWSESFPLHQIRRAPVLLWKWQQVFPILDKSWTFSIYSPVLNWSFLKYKGWKIKVL